MGEIEREIARLLDAVRRGAPADLVDAQVAPLAQERERLLAQADAPDTAALRTMEGLAGADVPTLLARLRGRPVEEQLRWLLTLYDHVEVWRGRIRLHYRGGVMPPADRDLPRRFTPLTS